MPCRDDWADEESNRRSRSDRAMLEASLCAVLTTLQKQGPLATVFNQVDWAEAGVGRAELERWWKEHQAEDARRRKAEAKERERLAAREAALAKLTPAERKLLGVRA